MRVFIIQEIIPFYRLDFFKEIEKRLPRDIVYFLYSNQIASGRTGVSNPGFAHEIPLKRLNLIIRNFSIVYQFGIISNIFKYRPAIVIFLTHVGNISYWMTLILAKILHFKTIGWVCGWNDKDSRLKDRLLKRFFAKFDFLLAYHTKAAKYLKQFGIHEDRIRILHNTINEKPIIAGLEADRTKAKELRAKYGLGEKVLLYVGTILKDKKIECLLDAMKILHDHTLIIVGDGPHRPIVQKYAQQLGLDNVLFAGKIIDGVDAYFEACNIFVMPGTGGLALNQAMIHSKPIITGRADGCEEDLVVEGENGYIIDNINGQKIVDTIRKIENQGIEAMGKRSFEIITTSITFDNFLNNFLYGIKYVQH